MGNETALIKLLTGLVDELRDVARDLARAGNGLRGESRDQEPEAQYRIQAMRRYYEYLGSALEDAESADERSANPLGILKPAAGAEPH